MSEYGRLWQQVRDIRDQLNVLVPGTSLAKEWSTLAAARETIERRTRSLNDLIRQWEALERDMANTAER